MLNDLSLVKVINCQLYGFSVQLLRRGFSINYQNYQLNYEKYITHITVKIRLYIKKKVLR